MRRTLPGLVLLGLLAGGSCSEGDALIQETGSLKLLVADRSLLSQLTETRTNQFVQFKVRKAEVDVPGIGTVNLLEGREFCLVEQWGLAYQDFCRFALALAPGPGTVTLRVELEAMTVVRATRPELTADGDLDEDGDLDLVDNCPYVSNEDQANENADEEGDEPVGDACTNANGFKDSDADTKADVIDNCVFEPNPLQQTPPAPGNSLLFADEPVGLDCEEKVQVMLSASGLIQRADVAFTIRDQALTNVVLDFNSNAWCGHGTTSCTLQPDDVILTVQ